MQQFETFEVFNNRRQHYGRKKDKVVLKTACLPPLGTGSDFRT